MHGTPESGWSSRGAAVRYLSTILWTLLLTICLLGACSEESRRLRDVQGLVRCIQLGDEVCVKSLTCQGSTDASSVKELLELAPEIKDSSYDDVTYEGQSPLGKDIQYNYDLNGKIVRVRFCPDEVEGSILSLELGPKE